MPFSPPLEEYFLPKGRDSSAKLAVSLPIEDLLARPGPTIS